MSRTGVTIWGRKNSVNVMKVLWACEELGLPYERLDVGGAFGGNDTPEYLAMNPTGRVPTIEDDGFRLWESNVIVRYLGHRYGRPGLCPEEPRERFLAEQWMDWQQTTLHSGMTTLFWGWVRTEPAQRDLDALETTRRNTAQVWAQLDAHLARQPFVAGEALTMGDIPAGCLAWRWFQLPIERPELPHVKAWYERLTEREGYEKHIMHPMT